MRTLGTTLGVLVFSGIFPLAPASVFAQGPGTASTQPVAAEYQRLRADLDRLNTDVAALKSGGRNVRTDYLLRDKMAEAEALARKLTEAEARLRATRGPLPLETSAGTVQTPTATAQDSAVELEAKADILSDQARRFRAEAESLARVAEQIRARQALRRRAGAWDRDPLVGFEASKRVAVISAQTSHSTAVASGDSSGASSTTRGSGTTTGDIGPKSGPVPAVSTDGSPSGGTATVAVSGPPTFTIAANPVTAPAGSVAAPAASHPLTAAGPLAADSASKATVSQRTLLDPVTLAGIRSSVSQAGSLSDPDAVDAAVTALRNHAQALDEHARRLRARANQP